MKSKEKTLNVLDLHIILHKPYPEILDETEALLWTRNGKPGNPVQYKAETVRYALTLANRHLKANLNQDSTPIHDIGINDVSAV